MLDKSYLWKHLLATRNADIYKLICQLVCAVDIIVETVELMNHILVLYTFFFQFLTTGMCRIYYYSNCWINNSYSNSVHIFFQIRLQCTIIYLLVEIFIRYLLFNIDSKFDYHGTIGDWFEVSLCFLVVIFFQESRNRNKSCFTSPVHSRADSVGWCFIHSWRRWHILVSCKQSNRQKQTTNWN